MCLWVFLIFTDIVSHTTAFYAKLFSYFIVLLLMLLFYCNVILLLFTVSSLVWVCCFVSVDTGSDRKDRVEYVRLYGVTHERNS